MTINQSRDYLVKFMERHFTDKTFGRYIRGERGGVNLAGDFAWQLARALRMIEAAQPAVPDGWKPVTRAGQVKVGDKPRIFRRKFTCESL